tara:strand:+ start:53 stop:706 length:654 start_codon:yes stop_codon:yes gene_type:complete
MCFLTALTPLLASSAAPATVAATTAGATAGATTAATTAGGGGLFGTSFLSSLGLGSAGTAAFLDTTLFTGGKSYLDMKRGNKLAAQMEEAADSAFALKQEGLGARLKEERKANAQEQLALAKKGLRAKGQLLAAERTGLTVDLLLGEEERKEGEAKNLLEQTMKSATQQYRRNTLGFKATRDNRVAEANSMRRGGLDVALDTIGSGLTRYYGLVGNS